MLNVSGIVNTVRSAVRSAAQKQTVDATVFPASPDQATVVQAIARFQGQPGWAIHLPEDPATFHTGNSEKAARFQRALSNTDQFAGWSTSHMCIWYTMQFLRSSPPRTYLEIGVNEGLSLFAMVTAIQFQYLLTQTRPPAALLDEIVLADVWGNQYGGTGKGSNEHIKRLVKSLPLDLERVRFLDGDSKQTIPAFFASRKSSSPFDAAYVDGDHSYHGAKTDLENVIPHVGKVLFFDDMYHPAHAVNDRLLELHKSMVERLKSDFYVFVNRRWYGFAAFIRKEIFDALPI